MLFKRVEKYEKVFSDKHTLKINVQLITLCQSDSPWAGKLFIYIYLNYYYHLCMYLFLQCVGMGSQALVFF